MTTVAVRRAEVRRRTRETEIACTLGLDRGGEGAGAVRVGTGLGFLDHMLATLALHAGWSLELSCRGDLAVDDHHSVEDCALALGAALDAALGDRSGVARFGWAIVPLDEALSRVVVDLVTRPSASVELGLRRESIGGVACENLTHFFRSLATAARLTLHVDVLKGENDHHRVESAFKALALALRQAAARTESAGPPSAKGVM